EEGDRIGDALRRQGREDPDLRSARWRRDRAVRMVPRGSVAAAHAARRHRVRLRRGADHLRADRGEGLDLQGRAEERDATPGPAGSGADLRTAHADAEKGQVPEADAWPAPR